MQERRAQGLCYSCDEKYVAGHRCATGRYLLLILDPDETFDEENSQPKTDSPQTDTNSTYFHLSPQACIGQIFPKTLKFKGLLHGLVVTVLIDTRSTHNILQPRIASHLHLPHTPIPNFSIMVGNGSRINCAGFCPHTPITLQSHIFTLPFYLFPIEGADVILGMAWLRTLDLINADFSVHLSPLTIMTTPLLFAVNLPTRPHHPLSTKSDT